MKRERSLNTARLLSLITLVSMGFAVVISSRFRVTCSLALSVKQPLTAPLFLINRETNGTGLHKFENKINNKLFNVMG